MSNRSQITRWIGIALLLVGLTHWSNAAETKLFIFWDTVSPDGRYALGWSTTGTMDPEEIDREESDIKNGLVDVASKKMLIVLPGASYWVSATERSASEPLLDVDGLV